MEPTLHRDPGRPCDRCGAFAPLASRGGQLVCGPCRDRLRTAVETALVSAGLALHLSQEVVEGTGPPSLRRAAVRVRARFRALMVVDLGVILQAGLGMILLVVPGVIIALSLFVARAIVISENPREVDAFAESRRRTRGHRLATLGASLVAGLPTVGVLVATLAIFHLAYQVAMLPPVFVAAALYAKTRPQPQLSVHPA